jgi:hypothetical protein
LSSRAGVGFSLNESLSPVLRSGPLASAPGRDIRANSNQGCGSWHRNLYVFCGVPLPAHAGWLLPHLPRVPGAVRIRGIVNRSYYSPLPPYRPPGHRNEVHLPGRPDSAGLSTGIVNRCKRQFSNDLFTLARLDPCTGLLLLNQGLTTQVESLILPREWT